MQRHPARRGPPHQKASFCPGPIKASKRQPDIEAVWAVKSEECWLEMEQRLDLELTAEPMEATRLRQELHQWLLRAGIDSATGHEITVSTVEAFANSVRHPVGRATAKVHVHGRIASNAVTLTVEDDGHWRKPERTRDSGGFGLALMRSFMTSVRIDRAERGTRVVLRRTLAGRTEDTHKRQR